MNTSVSGKLILNALAASSQFGEGTPGFPSPPLKISVDRTIIEQTNVLKKNVPNSIHKTYKNTN